MPQLPLNRPLRSQNSNGADAPSAERALATQADPPQPAGPNARRAVAALIAQATEQTTPNASELERGERGDRRAFHDRSIDRGGASERLRFIAARRPPTRLRSARSPPRLVAPQNQAGSVVASAVPERAAQNGNAPAAGSPRAETPDPSLGGTRCCVVRQDDRGAAEDAATRAFSSALNDATAGSHKLSQAFTTDAQEQSLAAARSSAAGASAAAGLGASQEKAAPAQANAPAEPKNFLENIVRQTRLLTRPDGASELTLNLQPSELGSVVVRLTLKGGHLDGHLQVDNQSARESLESVLPRVKQALAGEGIDLDRLEVAVRGDGSSRQSGQDSTRGRQASQAGGGRGGNDTSIEAPVGASAARAGRSAAAAGTMDFIV